MKAIKTLFVAVLLVVGVNVLIGVVRFPERYSKTWRYQLQNDIKRGDAEAIEYYNRVYVSNGIILFD